MGYSQFNGFRNNGFNNTYGYGQTEMPEVIPSHEPNPDSLEKPLDFMYGQDSLDQFATRGIHQFLNGGDMDQKERKIKTTMCHDRGPTFSKVSDTLKDAISKSQHRGYKTAHDGTGGNFNFPTCSGNMEGSTGSKFPTIRKPELGYNSQDLAQTLNAGTMNREYTRYKYGYQEYPVDYGKHLPGALGSTLIKDSNPGKFFVSWKRFGSNAAGMGPTSGYYAGYGQVQTAANGSMYPGYNPGNL